MRRLSTTQAARILDTPTQVVCGNMDCEGERREREEDEAEMDRHYNSMADEAMLEMQLERNDPIREW